eukprot:m.210215 g.210215  ORF g.210215 m.210215 type:complete len:202 (+) comp15822_c0_seq3:927-1532(+)
MRIYSSIYVRNAPSFVMSIRKLKRGKAKATLHVSSRELNLSKKEKALVLRLDELCFGSSGDGDEDDFVVVDQIPSYLVLKTNLIDEFGADVFESCKDVIQERLRVANTVIIENERSKAVDNLTWAMLMEKPLHELIPMKTNFGEQCAVGDNSNRENQNTIVKQNQLDWELLRKPHAEFGQVVEQLWAYDFHRELKVLEEGD